GDGGEGSSHAPMATTPGPRPTSGMAGRIVHSSGGTSGRSRNRLRSAGEDGRQCPSRATGCVHRPPSRVQSWAKTAGRAPPTGDGGRRFLRHAEEVDDEDQRLVGLDDPAGAPAAVAQLGRDDDAAPAADLHAGHALVPAADDLAGAEPEGEGLAPVPGGVELLAGAPGVAGVV